MFSQIRTPILLLLVVLLNGGCGIVTWRDVYVARQTTGRGVVRLQELFGLSDCSVQVLVSNGWASVQVDHRRGCVIEFAHAVWVGPRVALFVDAWSQQIAVAYDTEANKSVPFAVMEAALQADVIKTYKVSPEELKAAAGKVF